jgi:hypothetical protein
MGAVNIGIHIYRKEEARIGHAGDGRIVAGFNAEH